MAFNFPDGASNGQTHTASNGTVYRYNGTTWVVDSAATTSTFDTRYLNTDGDGILSGSVTDQLPSGVISGSSQITITESQISDLSHTTLPSGLVSGSSQITDGSGILSGSVAAQLPTGTVSGSSQITNGSNIISGSTQIANLGYVSSSTVDTIQVMTTASYASITPVSGTLYIIQG